MATIADILLAFVATLPRHVTELRRGATRQGEGVSVTFATGLAWPAGDDHFPASMQSILSLPKGCELSFLRCFAAHGTLITSLHQILADCEMEAGPF